MELSLHANATTTPRTRSYIQRSKKPVAALAGELGVSETTIRRWRGRTTVGDRSHRPHKLTTSLSATEETLARVTDHIDEVQETLGRQMLLENTSTYLAFAESTYSEIDFITEIACRTGCGLLLDVNNVYVASTNQQWDSARYIDEYPLTKVQEIHLAGYSREADDKGRPLLIDTHDRPIDEIVWGLFERTIDRLGSVPTLIEWDAKVPTWPELKAEADRADAIMLACERKDML